VRAVVKAFSQVGLSFCLPSFCLRLAKSAVGLPNAGLASQEKKPPSKIKM
jgi:hypothetical protein